MNERIREIACGLQADGVKKGKPYKGVHGLRADVR